MKKVIYMRMTWNEICTNYPDQQVGITDVEWDDLLEVRSAVVVCSEVDHTRAEVNGIAACSNGKIFSRNTRQKSEFSVGPVTVNGL
ncbi:MAG: hypothetical protein K6E81_07610 [Lachnospiraceae bacterium]|nr:hypothetical protein [Lachnospiraceae bacterium]